MLKRLEDEFDFEKAKRRLELNSIYGATCLSTPKIEIKNPIKIEKVIFNDPATIVFWTDKTKTVVKCSETDIYDPEKGLAMAVAKKFIGTNKSHSNYMNEFKKWLPEEEELNQSIYSAGKCLVEGLANGISDYTSRIEKLIAENKNEAVNHPQHYNREGAIECIDEMELIFGKKETAIFCKLNAYKYRYRAGSKGDAEEDLSKSDWYINKYEELTCEKDSRK